MPKKIQNIKPKDKEVKIRTVTNGFVLSVIDLEKEERGVGMQLVARNLDDVTVLLKSIYPEKYE
jgi:hypothetical protein